MIDASVLTAELTGDMVRLRHDLHREPEIGLALPRTRERVCAELDRLGLESTIGTECDSVVAVIRGPGAAGGTPAPTVLLRADMDALPLTEESGEEFASTIPGAMHACGHDLHTAMLVGAARILQAHREQLAGDVVLMFQPGEEGAGGARQMLSEGVLEASGRRADRAFAVHVAAGRYPHGSIAVSPGATQAGAAWFRIKVRGRAGHGARPHLARDPIGPAASLVADLQSLVSRCFDPFETVVVSLGSIHAGQAANVVPGEAELTGTVRAFSASSLERVRREIAGLCQALSPAHEGVSAELFFEVICPSLNNDRAVVDTVRAVARGAGDDVELCEIQRSTGSEDFAEIAAEIPAAMAVIGACGSERDWRSAADNHSAEAVFSDEVLGLGALLHARWAIASLAELAGGDSAT